MSAIENIVQLESLASILLAVAALSPGFLIAFCRTKFITGRMQSVSVAAVEYVVASAIYYSIAAPIFLQFTAYSWLPLFLLFFGAPISIGLGLGIAHQKGWLDTLFRIVGLSVSHPAPTSWDYVFSNLRTGAWVVVTLRSHEQVFGFFGGASFASSDLSQRDIFVQDIRDAHWEALEDDGRPRGIWIHEEEIVMIEFIADEDQ